MVASIDIDIVSEHASEVNTSDRPVLHQGQGRWYYVSVRRACGHRDIIDVDHTKPADHPLGFRACREHAADPSVKCLVCQQVEDGRRPALLWMSKRSRGGSASGTGRGKRKPQTNTKPKPQKKATKKERDIAALTQSLHEAEHFLALVEAGRDADPEAVAQAEGIRDYAKTQLQRMGVTTH